MLLQAPLQLIGSARLPLQCCLELCDALLEPLDL
jgi:hypothetical protein